MDPERPDGLTKEKGIEESRRFAASGQGGYGGATERPCLCPGSLVEQGSYQYRQQADGLFEGGDFQQKEGFQIGGAEKVAV